MLDRKPQSWLYPKPTGDVGRDRNAQTLQFACLLFTFAITLVAILDTIARERVESPILAMAIVGLVAAALMNRAGRSEWAARIAILAVLLTAILLVLEARDGFRSHAMLVFPGLLLISVTLLDRASYVTTAGIVLLAVAAVGIAEKLGLTGAIPGIRTRTSYESIFFVDLTLVVFALIGSRIANDSQWNVMDLRNGIDQLSVANLKLTEAVAALRESEQQLVSIYNTVRDVVFYLAVEPEGQFRFVSVNEAFLRVTGLSRDAVVGKTVNEVIPESSLTMVLGKYRQAVEENTIVYWEETSDYPAGQLTGEVCAAPVSDNNGNCTHLVGTVHDITERKQAEAKLRESEARLKNAERLARIGNWHWDVKANRVTWSEEMFRIFGKPRDYTPNYEAFFRDLVPQDRERVKRAISEGLAGKGDNSLEFQITLPGGDVRTISIIGEVLESEGGLRTRMFGACQDITDIRRAQEATLARQKLESVGALATGIAHDFNNILGGVLAQADLALDELAAGTAPEEELKGIREGVIRGSEIVRQLMVYSGKESEVPEPADVSRIIEDMLDLLRISISKSTALETNLGKGLCQVRANPAQIRQIVMNLVSNASEAIGNRDGVISVKTTCVTVGRDAPGATSEQWATVDYLELEVSDTGCGIPLETQARVFDPFFTTKAAGRGLGLAVVHGAVQSLGGMIRLESEPGKGTKFRILLPCATASDEATNGQMARTPQTAGPCHGTILVVEDEDPLRRPTAKMLQKEGFTVIEANDGYVALQAIRFPQKPIDVLLLDVTLPGAPSREVFEQAKRLRPGMRVIVTSAYSEQMAAASLGGRVERFIRKPYRLGDLLDLVQKSLADEGCLGSCPVCD